ncbi:jg18287 [Pararge aegeria aegeria]|uniref:Jg18287 protein n=1 Tax=Pararge aegeria aegeria TaxID=348720 RepID=A0A8S4QQ33_9NEOP|nr:jg18287 [Pararge aegeria aegeria]
MNSSQKKTTMISFNCKSIKRSLQCVRDLCEKAEIIALQETWLLPHDLNIVQGIHSNFECAAISSVDLSAGVLRGRPYGGLALMWNKTLFNNVSVVNCSNDRIMAIRVDIDLRSFLVFNVYMPTDEIDNLPDFSNCLAKVSAIVEEYNVSSVYMLGDFNAHPSARFGIELRHFCDEQEWVWADITKLGNSTDTFTFISESHGSRRWLDHCLTTESAWKSVLSADVMYDVSWSDHFPLRIVCDIEVNESFTLDSNIATGRAFVGALGMQRK